MFALPSPRPHGRQKASRKEALRTIARILEGQMDEMGLSQNEKNARADPLLEHVKKVKTSHVAGPSK
jgi:hypothetical protein